MRPIPSGHQFSMRVRVTPEMTATFFECTIHPLYATFAIVEHAEYAARQVIRPFLDAGEDAVGSAAQIEHSAPAPVGAIVTITARVIEVDGRSIVCEFEARWRDGTVARGQTTQRVVSKEKLRARIDALYNAPGTAEPDSSIVETKSP